MEEFSTKFENNLCLSYFSPVLFFATKTKTPGQQKWLGQATQPKAKVKRSDAYDKFRAKSQDKTLAHMDVFVFSLSSLL